MWTISTNEFFEHPFIVVVIIIFIIIIVTITIIIIIIIIIITIIIITMTITIIVTTRLLRCPHLLVSWAVFTEWSLIAMMKCLNRPSCTRSPRPPASSARSARTDRRRSVGPRSTCPQPRLYLASWFCIAFLILHLLLFCFSFKFWCMLIQLIFFVNNCIRFWAHALYFLAGSKAFVFIVALCKQGKKEDKWKKPNKSNVKKTWPNECSGMNPCCC